MFSLVNRLSLLHNSFIPTMFIRKEYLSQTEVLKRYRITPERYKALLIENNISQVNRNIDFGGYTVNTIYVAITEVVQLMEQNEIVKNESNFEIAE